MAGGRIRTLKPELLEDQKTAELSDAASRLFTAMILLADDHGNLRADGRHLKAQVWWARDEIQPKHAISALLELAGCGLIVTYAVNQQVYAHIVNWSKHQRVDNAGKAKVPSPSDGSPTSAEILREPPRLAAGYGSGKGEEGNGKGLDMPLRGDRPPRGGNKKLPPDWIPARTEANEEAERAAKHRGVDLRIELQKLRDWANANNAKKADWEATWRNWTRNAKPLSGPSKQASWTVEDQQERVRMLEEQERAESGT